MATQATLGGDPLHEAFTIKRTQKRPGRRERERDRVEKERHRQEYRVQQRAIQLRQEQVRKEREERLERERKTAMLHRFFPPMLFIPASSDASDSEDDVQQDLWVKSNLPYLPLEEHRAGCLLCMMDFDEPRKKDDIDFLELWDDPEPLRLLPCGHAFHQSCLDPWILNESRNCPYCRKDTGFHM